MFLRIAHELLGQLGKVDTVWAPDIIPSKLMREIIVAVEDGQINGQSPSWSPAVNGQKLISTGTTGKTIIKHLISTRSISAAGPSLSSVLDQLGLNTSSSSADLPDTCREVINALPDVANTIRKGNDKPVMRLVGEIMKRSKGRADPKEARRILLELLSSTRSRPISSKHNVLDLSSTRRDDPRD